MQITTGYLDAKSQSKAGETRLGKEILERQVFHVGEVVFRVGEPPRCAYLIQSGTIDVMVPVSGTDQVVDTLEAGELLGEMALVDSQPRSATAVAKVVTTCIVITPTDFQHRLEKSDPFVRAMLKVLTRRLRKSTNH